MTDSKHTESKNQGEGDHGSARAYNEKTKAFTESGKVAPAAQDAKKAVSGSEKADLDRAEAEGKRHSHGEDPLLKK